MPQQARLVMPFACLFCVLCIAAQQRPSSHAVWTRLHKRCSFHAVMQTAFAASIYAMLRAPRTATIARRELIHDIPDLTSSLQTSLHDVTQCSATGAAVKPGSVWATSPHAPRRLPSHSRDMSSVQYSKSAERHVWTGTQTGHVWV